MMLNVPNSIPSYASPHLSPTDLESVEKPLRKFTGGRPVFMNVDRWTTIGSVEWTDKHGKKYPDWRFISRPDNKDSVSAIPFWIAQDGSIILALKDELRQTLQRGVLGFCAGAVDKGENPYDSNGAEEILDEQNVVVRELKEELGITATPEQMLTPAPRAALLDSVSDCLCMTMPFYMGSEAEMADIGEQKLKPGEDIKPCFFHLKDLPALLTLLKESGHPCTQELSSFIMGYMCARLEDQVKEQKAVAKGEQLPAVEREVKKLWVASWSQRISRRRGISIRRLQTIWAIRLSGCR